MEKLLTTLKIILAVYYTLADLVLLGQCFYYRGFTWRDEVPAPKPAEASERTALLHPNGNGAAVDEHGRRWSNVDGTHLSPVTPLLDAPKPNDPPAIQNNKPTTAVQAFAFNLLAVLMVCAAGILGWYVSNRSQSGIGHPHHQKPEHPVEHHDDALQFSLWGQIFGYFCAVLYLGSRLPQILLNYRRKSTEGVSMLFFLFACIGNLTYVLSIFAFDPKCQGKCAKGEAAQVYWKYILVNASWLAGSLGTLFLDLGIFIQFFLYRPKDDVEEEEEEEETVGGDVQNGHVGSAVSDERPLLERGDTSFDQ